VKWAKACFLVLLVGTARAQVPDARPPDVSARWAEYYAAVYQVPVDLVAAIIDEESGWNPYAVSRTAVVAHQRTRRCNGRLTGESGLPFFDTAQLFPATVPISCASVKPDRSCGLPDAVLMVILA
jgi:hypothetical protein